MTEQLGDDDVKCLLDSINIGAANQAELHNPLMQQAEIEDNIRINVARLTNTNTGPKGRLMWWTGLKPSKKILNWRLPFDG